MVRPTNARYDQCGYERQLSKAQTWQLLEDMGRWWPDEDLLFHFRMINVCSQGMVSGELDEYLTQEMLCSEYKVGPVTGGLDEWPALYLDAFKVIRRTHIAIQNEKMAALKKKTQ